MILIYGKPGCPHCVEAKALAERKGLNYNYTAIGSDMMVEDFKELFPEARTVPQIVIDGVKIGGYAEFREWVDNQPQLLQG